MQTDGQDGGWQSAGGADSVDPVTLPSPLDPAIRAATILEFDLGHAIEDPHLDAICRFVAGQCGCPIAFVSLVDAEEQRFLGRAGSDWTCTPRSTAFCAVTMSHGGPLVVPDARLDPRFADYAIVTGDPFVRFYAGAPLVTADGVPLGAVCVLDTVPHETGLTETQRNTLTLMADAIMDRLTLRRVRRDGRVAAHDAAIALDQSELRFQMFADAMPQMAWSSRPDGFSDYFNARWYEFTGRAEGACDGDEWSACLHPDDLDRTLRAWRHCVDSGDLFDIEYRLRRADGQYRWTLTRGVAMRDEEGRIIRWFGTCTDIHDHRLALEEREIVGQELSHRIKNIFAVISGLVGLSARDRPEYRPAADSLRERILALGRAHNFVRPFDGSDARPTLTRQNSLHGLLDEILSPYETHPGARITIQGQDIAIDDRSATPLALLFHEIVTNAAKYGALSVPDGHITLSLDQTDGTHVVMRWQEAGGPPVGEIRSTGFGSQLLDLSVRRQLGGDYTQLWNKDGLVMTARIPASAFSRRA